MHKFQQFLCLTWSGYAHDKFLFTIWRILWWQLRIGLLGLTLCSAFRCCSFRISSSSFNWAFRWRGRCQDWWWACSKCWGCCYWPGPGVVSCSKARGGHIARQHWRGASSWKSRRTPSAGQQSGLPIVSQLALPKHHHDTNLNNQNCFPNYSMWHNMPLWSLLALSKTLRG